MIVGVIGLGSIGMVHAKNLLAMGHSVLGYDVAEHPIGEFGIEWIPNVLELTKKSDAVVVASPTHCHFDDAVRSVSWPHKKPVLIEKPIGRSFLETQTMLQIAADQGVTVMTANNMRYHPVVKVVKERMHELGGSYHGAWFRLHQENKDAKDPVILNWGAHEVDLALYLLDKKLTVMPGHSKIAHDHAEFIIRYGSGSLVHMDLSYHGPSERCFTIHGPDASIHADLDNFVVHIFSRYGREVIAVEDSHEQTYVDEMKEFIRRVEGHSSDGIGATGEDGLRCLKVLLEAQK